MNSIMILGRNLELKHYGRSCVGQRRWLIRNQNTQRTDERDGNKSRKDDYGKIHENVPSVQCVAVLSFHNI